MQFRFVCSYQCESNYECVLPTGERIRLSLRWEAPEYIKNYISDADIRFVPEYVQAIGILRSTQWYKNSSLRDGEVTPDVLTAFNQWLKAEHEKEVQDIFKFWQRFRPEATREEVIAQHPPRPEAVAGCWQGLEKGWVRIESKKEEACLTSLAS